MKVLIIGLGNIGTVYGWALAEAGADITHVVRKGKRERYEDSVSLDILDMRQGREPRYATVYRPRVVEEVAPESVYELVMVPTKEYQLIAALGEYADKVSPDACFLPFCANWEGTGAVDEIIPRSRYVWGFAAANGGPSEGVLYMNVRDDYRIGMMQGNRRELLDRVVNLFASAGFRPDLKENMPEWLWIHHATNAGVIGAGLDELHHLHRVHQIVAASEDILVHTGAHAAPELLLEAGAQVACRRQGAQAPDNHPDPLYRRPYPGPKALPPQRRRPPPAGRFPAWPWGPSGFGNHQGRTPPEMPGGFPGNNC
ncbi:MAG: 2-dehydropantoate 2-reductase N-terminal domain-containing protein [Actinomycetota bacterium]|nr:2-dehydropantoate 2-reductase N-terminal domain-containing protein [Actinomycetota bacterium]